MKNKLIVTNLFIFLLAAMVTGCSKYQEIGNADYPEETVYLPAAVNGIYDISTVVSPYQIPTSDSAYRYYVDRNNNKLVIPLGVFRAGITKNGVVDVKLVTDDALVNNMISQGLLANTILLSSANYTIPSELKIENGKELGTFNVLVDLNFIKANTTSNHALAVTISEANRKINDINKTVVVVIKPGSLTL